MYIKLMWAIKTDDMLFIRHEKVSKNLFNEFYSTRKCFYAVLIIQQNENRNNIPKNDLHNQWWIQKCF